MTYESQGLHMCSRASAFSEKLVIHWLPAASFSPKPHPSHYHLRKLLPKPTCLDFKFSSHHCPTFLHSLQAKIPRALATMAVSAASFFTLNPLQEKHSLQGPLTKSPMACRFSISCTLPSAVLPHLSAAFNIVLPFPFWNILFFWVPELHILLIFLLALWLLLWQLLLLCLTSNVGVPQGLVLSHLVFSLNLFMT